MIWAGRCLRLSTKDFDISFVKKLDLISLIGEEEQENIGEKYAF
jgi:hypothetical protein